MNRKDAGQAVSRSRESGAAAVEFAFVFPFLFLLMYGIITYAYTFVLQESLTYAAQESAEAAVAVDPSMAGADTVRAQRVRAMASAILSWLPDSQKQRVIGTSGERVQITYCTGATSQCPADTNAIVVTLTFSMTTPTYLFPVMQMPFVGAVPPLPDQLTATAVTRI